MEIIQLYAAQWYILRNSKSMFSPRISSL